MIRKDLSLFFNDRRAVIMSFVAPIVIGAFFGYIFGGLGGRAETSRIHVLVADADQSAVSKDILSRLRTENSLDVKKAMARHGARGRAEGFGGGGNSDPEGFRRPSRRAMFTGTNKPELGLLYDPSHAPEQGMVQGILTGSVMQAVSREVFSGASMQRMTDQGLRVCRIRNGPH